MPIQNSLSSPRAHNYAQKIAGSETVAASPLRDYIHTTAMTITISQRAIARVREEMTSRDLTQTDVSAFSGLSQSKLSKIFHGVMDLTVEDLGKICEAVSLSPTEVVRDHGLEFCAEMSPSEMRFLERIRQLTDAQRDGLMQVLAIQKATRVQERRAMPRVKKMKTSR